MNFPLGQDSKGSDSNARKEFLETVGERVRCFRIRKSWTQEILAQEAQINDKYVYDIEKGNKCMTIWVLAKIAKALNVEMDKLLISDENDITGE